MTEPKLDLMALLLAQGESAQSIAAKMDIAVETARKHLKSDKVLQIAEGYRNKILEAKSRHQQVLLEMLDESNKAVREALRSGDKKLAKDTALQVWDRLGFGQHLQPAAEEGGQTPRAHIEIGKVLVALSENVGAVLTEAFSADPSKHTLEGDEALPQALLDKERASIRRAETSEEAEIIELAFESEESASGD